MMTVADTGPELPDLVALLLCHVRGDQDAAVGLLTSLGPDAALALVSEAITAALAVAYEFAPGGRAEVEGVLVSWQERRRDGLSGTL